MWAIPRQGMALCSRRFPPHGERCSRPMPVTGSGLLGVFLNHATLEWSPTAASQPRGARRHVVRGVTPFPVSLATVAVRYGALSRFWAESTHFSCLRSLRFPSSKNGLPLKAMPTGAGTAESTERTRGGRFAPPSGTRGPRTHLQVRLLFHSL